MLKNHVTVAAFTAALLFLSACGSNTDASTEAPIEVPQAIEVKGINLSMKEVPGGTFALGTLKDRRLVKGYEKASQQLMDGYAISETPVSQALWTAVMGGNPSSTVSEGLPVDRVTAKDCEKFVKKLSKITGLNFMLPTESQWEYAVHQGIFAPAEGLREWCAGNVVRTYDSKENVEDYVKAGALGFRVAVALNKPCDPAVVAAINGIAPEREHQSKNEEIKVNGVTFSMVAVDGGSFEMGATEEQGQYAGEDEKPSHSVDVESFEIGRTEVTAGQWLAVMGWLPAGNYTDTPDYPVVNVSWYAAQEFILRLNALTGRTFRLPTEAEWEYAARGGKRSSHSRFAGSNQIDAVAVYEKNAVKLKVTKVKTKKPNELGLYDMSGNAWEWCQDAYAPYGGQAADNGVKVNRGGSAASRWDACRVSNRSKIPADNPKGTFGFRLAI